MATKEQPVSGDIVQRIRHLDWRQPGKVGATLKTSFDAWLTKQPLAFEVAVATASGAAQGAFLGGMMGALQKMDPKTASVLTGPQSNPNIAAMQMAGPWVQARNFAVMTGVNAGLTLAIKRYRGGKEDARGAMMAAFGSGAAFSLVSGMGGANPIPGAFSTGVVFALLQGGLFKLGQKFSGGSKATEDVHYAKAKHLLTSLGFDRYTRHIKRAALTDNTIMLWNESALREARIPPGPRLLILHHIDRYRHILKPGMPVPNSPPPSRQ